MATSYDFDVSISSAVSKDGERSAIRRPATTGGQERVAVGPLTPALLRRLSPLLARMSVHLILEPVALLGAGITAFEANSPATGGVPA